MPADDKEDPVTASSAETTQDADSASSTEIDEGAAVESPTTDGAAATDSPAAETERDEKQKKLSEREKIIAELTGATVEATDSADDAETEPEPAAQEDQAETTEVEAAAKAETPAADKPKELSDADLEVPKDAKPKQRERWQKLLADRKAKDARIAEMEPLAGYGKSMLDFAAEARMTPEDLGAGLAFLKEINDDPKKAPARLMAHAEALAKQQGVTLPQRQPTVAPLDPKLIDDLDELLVDKIANLEIPADAGKALREKLKVLRKGAASAPPPAQPEQVPARVEAPNPQQPAAPRGRVLSPTEQRAAGEIKQLAETYAKQSPTDWPKIIPVVQAAMKRYAGVDPQHWPAFFKEEVAKAKAKLGTPAKPVTRQTPLRPTTTTAAKKPLTGRAESVALLTGKKT